jgi:hypothetical protein
MTRPADSRLGSCYELRVAGHLDDRWSTRFSGFTLTREDDGTTTLRGPVADQAELHGHLARVRDLGATLVSLRALDAHTPPCSSSTDPTEQE